MSTKKFSQKEVNGIIAARIKRERERLAKEFENKMKRCMASIHLMLHQEMCTMKRDMATETQDLFDPLVELKDAVEPAQTKKSEKNGA